MTGLFGSHVLEAALGLAGVYLWLAMCCSTLNEWIAGALSLRARMLERSLCRLLGEAASDFYAHPMIQSAMHGDAHPDRISAGAVAQTILDLAAHGQPGEISFCQLERGIAQNLPDGPLRGVLLAALRGRERRVDAARAAIEEWYDSAMEGLTQRYRKLAQMRTALLAAVVTVAANADSLRLAKTLLGGGTAADCVGWGKGVAVTCETVVGWALTTVAVSLGAPFWFDVARRLVARTLAGKSAPL